MTDAPEVFAALTSAFGGGRTGSDGAAPRRTGVLPAVRQRVQQIQEAIPEGLPKPNARRISDPQGIPTWLIGLGIPLAGVLGILLGASAVGYLRRRSAYY